MTYCAECGLSFSEAVDEGLFENDDDTNCPDCGGEWVNDADDEEEQ